MQRIRLRKTPLYASIDVEADGDNPLLHNMLSIGIALFDAYGQLVDTFYQNISPQPGKIADPKTMEHFWAKYPQMYADLCTHQVTPEQAMMSLDLWLKKYIHHHRITWVAAPASFDWMFFKSYFSSYGPPNKTRIGFYCVCIHSLARSTALLQGINVQRLMAKLGGERNVSEVHHALSDAIYQGHCYMMLRHEIKTMTTHEITLANKKNNEHYNTC
jgi:DNA polymerase III epsilon subunit-like protein